MAEIISFQSKLAKRTEYFEQMDLSAKMIPVMVEAVGKMRAMGARALPSGPDRHNILQEIGRFRARIVALQGVDLQPAQVLKAKGK